MQRMVVALKEISSVQGISRKEYDSYTTKHKVTTLRVGFLTNKASWINSKEKAAGILETEYPSNIGQKSDWKGDNIRHVPEGKS